MKKAVIFDIDGTLAKISKNEDGTPKRDYHDYDKVDLDEPIEEIVELLIGLTGLKNLFGIQIQPLFITGRKEFCREKTALFLYKELRNYSPTEEDEIAIHVKETKRFLFMRPDNDHRKAVELKKEIYETKIKGNYDVVMAFDDDPEVCKMYKEQGILTMQVMTKD